MTVGRTNPTSSAYALRSELTLERGEDGTLVVADPLSGRHYRFDEMQAEVVLALRSGGDLEAIAAEVLGDADELETVRAFVTRLGREGLLADSRRDEIAASQARARRADARRRRDERVAESVRWAAKNLPFYRDRIGSVADDVAGVADLSRLPTTSKSDLRRWFPAGFVPDGTDLSALAENGEIMLAATSGSTGGRLEFLYDFARSSFPPRFPGLSVIPGGWDGARIARFTTPICNGAVCHRGGVPYEERLVEQGYLFLNSTDRILQMGPRELEDFAADVARFQPNVLLVDPFYLVALVRALQRNGAAIPEVRAVWTSFEFLSARHRRILADTFGAPVTDFLAATDLAGGVAAFTCENGRFHVNEREYVFEFLRGGQPVGPDETGEVTVTSLNHRFTRQVRYRLGDLAVPVERCGCSCDDTQAFEFEGRLQDCLLDTRGRPVTTRQVDELFDELDWVDFYQLVQLDSDRYELSGIRNPGVSEVSDETAFSERVSELLGPSADVRIRYVREFPVEPSFKFPRTKSRVWETTEW